LNGLNEEKLREITELTQKKIQKLFEKYPCINFTSTTEKNSAKIKGMVFNEQYLQELGYSLESFATTILQEGFPRLMPIDTACCAKILIDNYYTLGSEGAETPEIVSDIIIKNGYMRKIRYKMYYFPSYRNRAYDVSAVLVITGKERTVTMEEREEKCEMNKRFLKKIIRKEKEINKFMHKFYDRTLNLPYTSVHKVCRIRDLDVKDEEEESLIQEENGLLRKEMESRN